MISSEWILILDFGGQYTQLITRAVRRAGTYSEILPYNSDPDQLSSRPKGIILSGGPESVYADQSPQHRARKSRVLTVLAEQACSDCRLR